VPFDGSRLGPAEDNARKVFFIAIKLNAEG
jgi:hypothetical protein